MTGCAGMYRVGVAAIWTDYDPPRFSWPWPAIACAHESNSG